MNLIDNKKLQEIEGGNGLVTGLLIAAGITFAIGVLDGFVRPLRCN